LQTPNAATITCPSCGEKNKIKEGADRFTCAHCGSEQAVAPAASQRVAAPDSVEISQGQDGAWRISRRVFAEKHIFMAFFTVGWGFFIIFWYSGMTSGSPAPGLVLFSIIHVASTFYLAYATLAGFLNRTVIELNRETLRVFHEPVWWPGAKTLPITAVQQFFSKEKVRRFDNDTRITYELYALLQNDRQARLISGMETPDEARFFEQQLEEWLHLTDRPVSGEYRQVS
jgi:predicted RNA-binding Zn-ribbon protein involved in translation (DUF1610 family)